MRNAMKPIVAATLAVADALLSPTAEARDSDEKPQFEAHPPIDHE
jgi:hypothetical protein